MTGMIFSLPRSLLLLCLLLASLVGSAAPAPERLVYRYVMPDGRIVVTDSPLPQHAAYGYDIIDPDTDRVIRRVDPQRSSNEYHAEQARRRALEACQNELRSLRYRYEKPEDIDLARDNTLGAIQHRSQIIRNEITRAELDLENSLVRAAESERAGASVDRQLTGKIASLRESIASLQTDLAQKAVDLERAKARYAREAERFADGSCDHLQ